MKFFVLLTNLFFQQIVFGQKNITISFQNDYGDVYHLSLIIYTPDGKNQTRVGNLHPDEVKTYTFPVGTEIFIADNKQEAFAMKGNDIKATGLKPTITLGNSKDTVLIIL